MSFFKNRSKSHKVPNKKKSREEQLSTSWVSTDPKDLPEGHTVGSMTVPWPPPYYVKKSDEDTSSRKRSKKDKKVTDSDSPKLLRVKESKTTGTRRPFSFHRRTPSAETVPAELVPLKKTDSDSPKLLHVKESKATGTRRPFFSHRRTPSAETVPAVLVPLKKTSVPSLDSQSKKGSDQTDGGTVVRREKLSKIHIQRSCSVDALDEISGKGDFNPPPSVIVTQLRRTSTETDKLSYSKEDKPQYNRWTSYHGVTSTSRIQSQRANLYKRPAVSQDSPTLSIGYRREMSTSTMQKLLSRPKSVENLFEIIQSGIDVNALDEETGDAPIHSIAKRKRKDRLELLMALLINSTVDVNLLNSRGNSALHLAVEEGDELCVKALVVFGANINLQGSNQFTPFDLTIDNGRLPELESLFMDLGAKSSVQLIKPRTFSVKVPRMHSVAENLRRPLKGERLCANDKLAEFINRRGVKKLYKELEMNVNRRLSLSTSLGSAEDAYALVLQQRELALYNKTLRKTNVPNTGFAIEGGSRMLFLDGGGIKGLVQLEILMQIEEETGRTITELFDWIIGSSTGGVIALALVYAKKSLHSLRQLYFKLKDRIFAKARYGFGYNSEALEEILQEYLDPDVKMTDVSHPKVLIAAVNKATTNLELHFFNNCFGDDYCDFHVWKVARYTCAAPMFFTEVDNYVDGGVIANNPTDCGMTAIQNFFRLQGMKLPIAMVVSVGTGVYPASKMGKIDAQDALFFGKQWLKPSKLIKKTQNLFALLSNALVESEMVASNSKSRCQEQNIPFYRFSPHLEEIVAAGETDNDKLFSIVLKAKVETRQQGLLELVDLFRIVAASNRHSASSLLMSGSIAEEEGEEQDEQQENLNSFAVETYHTSENGEVEELYEQECALTFNERQSSPRLNERQSSPRLNERQSSPRLNERQSSDERQSSPRLNERQSSPHLNERQSSPHLNERQSSPHLNERQSSPHLNERQSSPRLNERQSSPRLNERQSSPHLNERQSSPRSNERQSSPRLNERQSSPHLVERQSSLRLNERQSSPRLVERQSSPRLDERQSSPRLDERQSSPRLVERQSSPRLDERQSSPRLDERQSSPCLDERQSSPHLNERQSSPRLDERQSSPRLDERQSSPRLDERQFSPRLNERQSSPRLDERQSSPRPNERQSSPRLNERQSSPRLNQRQSSPRLEERQSSPHNLNERKSSPHFDERQSSPCLEKGQSSPILDEAPSSPILDEAPSSPILDEAPSSPFLDEKLSSSLLDEEQSDNKESSLVLDAPDPLVSLQQNTVPVPSLEIENVSNDQPEEEEIIRDEDCNSKLTDSCEQSRAADLTTSPEKQGEEAIQEDKQIEFSFSDHVEAAEHEDSKDKEESTDKVSSALLVCEEDSSPSNSFGQVLDQPADQVPENIVDREGNEEIEDQRSGTVSSMSDQNETISDESTPQSPVVVEEALNIEQNEALEVKEKVHKDNPSIYDNLAPASSLYDNLAPASSPSSFYNNLSPAPTSSSLYDNLSPASTLYDNLAPASSLYDNLSPASGPSSFYNNLSPASSSQRQTSTHKHVVVNEQVDSERDRDFLLSYQTFAKQHGLEKSGELAKKQVLGSKQTKDTHTHYKLETRTSNSSLGSKKRSKNKKKETTI